VPAGVPPDPPTRWGVEVPLPASPHEVRELLAAKVGNLLEFVEDPEATQYFQSHALWPDSVTAPMEPL